MAALSLPSVWPACVCTAVQAAGVCARLCAPATDPAHPPCPPSHLNDKGLHGTMPAAGWELPSSLIVLVGGHTREAAAALPVGRKRTLLMRRAPPRQPAVSLPPCYPHNRTPPLVSQVLYLNAIGGTIPGAWALPPEMVALEVGDSGSGSGRRNLASRSTLHA